MLATGKALTALKAADIMSRDVIMIPQEMSLRAAAHLLCQAQITGAPVVDDAMRCVGVLSATDFVHWAESSCQTAFTFSDPCQPVCDWEVLNINILPAEEVRAHMTPVPVVANPQTPLGELARLMIDAHIHRVIVVDGNSQPIGIVSSSDILAAVANLVSEPCE